MPRLIRPTSDLTRLALLQQGVEMGMKDRAAGRNYISERTLVSLQKFNTLYAGAVQAVVQATGERRQATQEVGSALAALDVQVQSLRATLRRQVQRGQLPPAVLTYYGIPLQGVLPRPRTRTEWLELGAQLLAGDAAAKAAGFAGAINRAPLEEALNRTQQAMTRLHTAAAALHVASDACTDLRTEANRLCHELTSELRYLLRAKPASVRRKIMRDYGIRFVAQINEAEEIKE